MIHFLRLLLFIFLLWSASLMGQKPWTLDECISYALENNLQLNDFEYNNLSNKETYRQSVRNLLPVLNANSDYTVNSGRAEDPNTGTFVVQDFFSNNYSLQSNIDLFRGFQKINSIKASKLLYNATQEEVLQPK